MASGQYMSVKGPSRDAMFRRPKGWSEGDNPPRRNLPGGTPPAVDPESRLAPEPAGGNQRVAPPRPKRPKKSDGPTATTGQPTKPGRGFPRGGMVRDIVEAKMKKIQATPRQQLAAQPIDRNFSA